MFSKMKERNDEEQIIVAEMLKFLGKLDAFKLDNTQFPEYNKKIKEFVFEHSLMTMDNLFQ